MDKKTVLILGGILVVCCCVISAIAIGVVFVIPAVQPTPTPSPTLSVKVDGTDQPIKTPTALPSLISKDLMVFYDTFDNNDNNWEVEKKVGERVEFEEKIEGGKLIFDMAAKNSVILYDTIRSQAIVDFELAVDAEQASGSIEGDLGLIFRKLDKDNYYLFGINPNYQEYFFSVRVNGEWKDLIKAKKSSIINLTGVNKMKVIGSGNKFSLYVNGQLLETYTDSSITSGGEAGVAVELFENGQVAKFVFDNFSLRVKK